MVRIVNGEIVRDDGPQARTVQRRPAAGARDTGGQQQGQVGYGRVASLLDPPSKNEDNARNPTRGSQGAVRQPGPLDKLAEAIGIQDRFVRVPGGLGVPEREVPLVQLFIYLAIAAVAVAYGGWKVLVLLLVGYVVMNQQGRTDRGEGR